MEIFKSITRPVAVRSRSRLFTKNGFYLRHFYQPWFYCLGQESSRLFLRRVPTYTRISGSVFYGEAKFFNEHLVFTLISLTKSTRSRTKHFAVTRCLYHQRQPTKGEVLSYIRWLSTSKKNPTNKIFPVIAGEIREL